MRLGDEVLYDEFWSSTEQTNGLNSMSTDQTNSDKTF